MEPKKEVTKEAWTEPKIYSIDFKETQGGPSPYAFENSKGTVSSLG